MDVAVTNPVDDYSGTELVMRARALLGSLAVVASLATGCGSATVSGTQPKAGHDVSRSPMNMNMGSTSHPSNPAAMICGPEIRAAVGRTFALTGKPVSTPHWSTSDRVFSCTYQLPQGRLALSVQDSLDAKQGRTYFEGLRRRLSGATPLRGMENFGFPAFTTATGRVVFLKDGKTLQVDASALPARALPMGYSREDAAFSVASAVIGCWTE
jgi:hypothetical protein